MITELWVCNPLKRFTMNLFFVGFVYLNPLKYFFKIEGELEVGYVSGETPMVVYLNVHMAIEQMRQKLEKENRKAFGPRVICFLIYNRNQST